MNILNMLLTWGIGIIILLITIYFFYEKHQEKKNETYTFESSLPNIASALGVLGTFGGIVIGLLNFNVNTLETSVPLLLEGMKTAFITSVCGMLASIIMNSVNAGFRKKYQQEEDKVDDGAALINLMIKELKNLNETLVNNNEQIDYRFIKMDENWNKKQDQLIGEINKFNTSSNEKQEELIKEFRSFAQTMAEENSKSLIEALEEVVRDFNTKISEQFGENFKHLNEAVGKMVTWQDKYKEHIEKTTAQLEQTVAAIKDIEGSMSEIHNKSYRLLEVAEKLDNTLTEMDRTYYNVYENMKTLSQISEDVERLLPNINNYANSTNESIKDLLINIDELMIESTSKFNNHIEIVTLDTNKALTKTFVDLSSHIQKSSGEIKKQVEEYMVNFENITRELKDAIPEVNEHIKATSNKLNNTLGTFTSEIDKALKLSLESIKAQTSTLEVTTTNIGSNLETTVKDMENNIENVVKDMSNQIKALVESSDKVFQDKIKQLDSALEHELKKSLNTLGTQLVQISDQFAKDYIPLAIKLKEVVNIARGVSA